MIAEELISEALVVEPSTPLSKVIGLMEDIEAYEAFMGLKEKVYTVTLRDILGVKAIEGVKVSLLARPVPGLPLSSDLVKAAKLLADHRLRALPVLEDGRMIGKLDVRAVVGMIKDSNLGMVGISKVASAPVITVSSADKAAKARKLMLVNKIDHLPVLVGQRLKGIVTSAHIVFNLIRPDKQERFVSGVPRSVAPLDFPIASIMEGPPLTCGPTETVKAVAGLMLKHNFTYCLITLGEELQGIATYRDFMKLIAGGGEGANVPISIKGLPDDDPFEAEAAKMKFARIINTLSRVMPLLEARSVIKTSSAGGERKRYEVDVTIRAARHVHKYSLGGWSLPLIFDELINILKKQRASRIKVRRGRSPLREF